MLPLEQAHIIAISQKKILMQIRCIYEHCVDIRRMGAASVDLAYVACGRVEAYFERKFKAMGFCSRKKLLSRKQADE